jgi:DNA primase large subunit
VDLERITRYPFRRETQEWVREQGVSLQEVLVNPVYRRVVKEGLARVMGVLGEEGLRDMTAFKEADALRSALTYPIARMLVSVVGDLMLVRRHALREAEAAARHMAAEDPDFLLELANDELRLPAAHDEDARTFTVHFTDYLKTASAIRDRAWKLYNQDLVGGRVRLGHEKFVRLLQEALRRRIESELPLDVTEEILEAMSEEIAEVVQGLEKLRASIQRESYGEFSLEYLPPCIADLLDRIHKGINVPHVGRFALTAFLSHVGLGVDDVIDLFRGSPDFKEDLAEYQVKHILGEISGTKYSPPSCSTMNTYGICLRAKECEGLGHPLRYYERRQRQAARERARVEGEAAEGEKGGTKAPAEAGDGGDAASGEVTPGGG